MPALATGKAGKQELTSEELIFNESETCSLFDDDIVRDNGSRSSAELRLITCRLGDFEALKRGEVKLTFGERLE